MGFVLTSNQKIFANCLLIVHFLFDTRHTAITTMFCVTTFCAKITTEHHKYTCLVLMHTVYTGRQVIISERSHSLGQH